MSDLGNLFFVLCGLLALGSALATVLLRSPLRAAVALLFHILALAGLYLTLHAHLLAALQLLVYAGAVVVLFVFVIMLLGPNAVTSGTSRGLMVRSLSAACMVLLTGALAMALGGIVSSHKAIAFCDEAKSASCAIFGGVRAFGRELYGTGTELDSIQGAVVPFELVSILLLVAVVGAIALAKGRSRLSTGERK